ncbi:hypothetical protein CspeluHIS016_0802180 [Cutaneotrichosporon spelunceum]|uniref:Uncharacterized protein n=1 Tax=Cutaneotrichosporon spelunceum TaxID=1672016 RepID=A0AAD3TZE1_9TREE|nr:hypothetical protein CspeluHIS016_0802180 [Cutaneotrichosporon spelunceum]
MRANRLLPLVESQTSTKPPAPKHVPGSKPTNQPSEKPNSTRTRNRGRRRGRGGAGGVGVGESLPKIAPPAQPIKEQPASWEQAFAQMEAQFQKEMTDPHPTSGWDETPKEKHKRLLVERWRVNVVPGAP